VACGRHGAAINDCDRALRAAPKLGKILASIRSTRAFVHTSVDRFQDADADLKLAAKADDSSHGKFLQGCIAMQNQDWKVAISHFSDALEVRPEEEVALLNRGVCHYMSEKRNYVEAEADFSRLILLAPRDYNAYFNRGVVRWFDPLPVKHIIDTLAFIISGLRWESCSRRRKIATRPYICYLMMPARGCFVCKLCVHRIISAMRNS